MDKSSLNLSKENSTMAQIVQSPRYIAFVLNIFTLKIIILNKLQSIDKKKKKLNMNCEKVKSIIYIFV